MTIAIPVYACSVRPQEVLDANGRTICVCAFMEERDELIRRINGWDGLVEALTAAWDHMLTKAERTNYAEPIPNGLACQIETALTAAQPSPSVSEGV